MSRLLEVHAAFRVDAWWDNVEGRADVTLCVMSQWQLSRVEAGLQNHVSAVCTKGESLGPPFDQVHRAEAGGTSDGAEMPPVNVALNRVRLNQDSESIYSSFQRTCITLRTKRCSTADLGSEYQPTIPGRESSPNVRFHCATGVCLPAKKSDVHLLYRVEGTRPTDSLRPGLVPSPTRNPINMDPAACPSRSPYPAPMGRTHSRHSTLSLIVHWSTLHASRALRQSLREFGPVQILLLT